MDKYYVYRPLLDLIGFTEGTDKGDGYSETLAYGVSLAGYVSSTVPTWAAEAAAFIAWRDAVWVYAYTELNKVQNGLRAQPTVSDFIAELPPIEWPSPSP